MDVSSASRGRDEDAGQPPSSVASLPGVRAGGRSGRWPWPWVLSVPYCTCACGRSSGSGGGSGSRRGSRRGSPSPAAIDMGARQTRRPVTCGHDE